MKEAANISGLEKIGQEEMEAILTDFDPIEVMDLYFLYRFTYFLPKATLEITYMARIDYQAGGYHPSFAFNVGIF